VSGWWIYEETEVAEGVVGRKEHEDIYVDDGENLNLCRDYSRVADAQLYILRDQVI
jgi:hypothetical protein